MGHRWRVLLAPECAARFRCGQQARLFRESSTKQGEFRLCKRIWCDQYTNRHEGHRLKGIGCMVTCLPVEGLLEGEREPDLQPTLSQPPPRHRW